MDNAKYRSRFVEKSRTMNMRKMILSYMMKHHIEIPLSMPVKPVLLQKICEANILKKYVVDEMTLDAGYYVLRLPPYHCVILANQLSKTSP